jgi:hypothetical protein
MHKVEIEFDENYVQEVFGDNYNRMKRVSMTASVDITFTDEDGHLCLYRVRGVPTKADISTELKTEPIYELGKYTPYTEDSNEPFYKGRLCDSAISTKLIGKEEEIEPDDSPYWNDNRIKEDYVHPYKKCIMSPKAPELHLNTEVRAEGDAFSSYDCSILNKLIKAWRIGDPI